MQPIRKLLSYTRDLRGVFIIITVLSVVGSLVSLATPLILKYGTDWVVAIALGKTSFDIWPLVALVGAFVAVSIVGTIAGDIGGYFGDLMAVRTRRQLSTQYFKHLLRLPQHYFDGEVTGKIINRLSRAISDVSVFLQFFANNLLQMLLTMIITFIVLAWYSWPIVVLFLLLIPTNIYVTTRTSKRWQRYEGQKNQHFDYASGRFAEVITQMRLVKSFNTEASELAGFDGEVRQMIGLTRKQSRWWHSMNALRSTIFGIIFALIYAILFYEAANGRFSVGDIVLLMTLIQQVIFPLRSISYYVDSYQRAVANSRDYLAAMAEKPEVESSQSEKLKVENGTITYDNVSFGYDDGKVVLQDISVSINASEKVALVGESGGGKTTFSNLLMRLYDADQGTITIDGVDISQVSRASVREHIATVFQDAALFSGTIRENIAYAKPQASETSIIAAAQAANALDFIMAYPGGLDTEIGERGVKLSGGQKQRIAIARALLKDAPILILDEATSSLDSKAEHEVQQALDRLMKGRTTIIIAHRLSTIASVDMIITIKKGRIDEIGAPDVLAKSGGIYAQLLHLQLGATEKAKQQLSAFDIAG